MILARKFGATIARIAGYLPLLCSAIIFALGRMVVTYNV